jgi:glycosyltransferase involved in cell wall biosynthesis
MSHTLLEAMAAGLPCIASSRGGNPELIDSGDNGILVEPQNVRQLTGALKLLEGDESLRASISQKARANIVNYDMEQMARRYTELLIEQ